MCYGTHLRMTAHRRRLPHIYTTEQPVFLTWRLHGSLPEHRPFCGGRLPSGPAFPAPIVSWMKFARDPSTFASQR